MAVSDPLRTIGTPIGGHSELKKQTSKHDGAYRLFMLFSAPYFEDQRQLRTRVATDRIDSVSPTGVSDRHTRTRMALEGRVLAMHLPAYANCQGGRRRRCGSSN
jgi:hypothetical protein